MNRRDRSSRQLRRGDRARPERVARPTRTVRRDGDIATALGKIDELAQGARSPPRARSPHRTHAELANDLSKNFTVAARTGQYVDTFAGFPWIMPDES